MRSMESKVGIFVFLGIFILALFVLKAGDVEWFRHGYYVEFVFPNVSGLKIGSPVRLAGVNIGSVKEVNIIYDAKNKSSQVEVYAYIDRDVQIPADSKVEIISIGLLGDKGIEITPGVNYQHMLRPGDILYGQKEVDLQELIEEGKKIAEEIRKGLSTFNQIIGDKELIETIKTSVSNFGSASKELQDTLIQLQDILLAIKNGEGTVGRIIYDDTLYVLLELTAYDLNRKLNAFLDDIRRHPWKLFIKTRTRTKKETRTRR